MSKAKTVKEVLEAARWMLDNVGWCQGAFARNKKGRALYNPLNYRLNGIGSFCASGAIYAVETDDRKLKDQTMDFLWRELFSPKAYSIPAWNDCSSMTKEKVLQTFDKAIAKASEK